MKKSDSHLKLAWKFNLTVQVPVNHRNVSRIAGRVLIAAGLITLALGLAPLASLLMAGP